MKQVNTDAFLSKKGLDIGVYMIYVYIMLYTFHIMEIIFMNIVRYMVST